MASIFLSHNSADKPFVRRLAQSLQSQGHVVWLDEAEINIGDSLIEKIREGLDKVDYVAVVLSQNSITSTWVQRELDISSNREIAEKRVILLPLMLQHVELPGFLLGKRYGDCCGQLKLATALEFFQYRFSDSFGGNPPLYSCGLSAL